MQLHILFTLFYLGRSSREIGKIYLEFNRASLERLETQLLQGVREKAWPDRGLNIVANQIHELIVGSAFKAMNEDDLTNWRPRAKRLGNAITKLLRHDS